MLKKLNHVVDYIESHLTDELPLEAIAAEAGMPDFHFRKFFFYLSGMTLSEYIKGRRLSEACKDLMAGERVTDVAFKYRYESMDGFTRAFKRWSGLLPSEIDHANGKSFPKFSFIITIKGGSIMDFRIEEKPAFLFAGVSKRVPMQFEGVNAEIVELARSITDAQKLELHALKNMEPREVVNVSYDADAGFLKEDGYLTHMIGVLTTKQPDSSVLETIPVEAGSWAVFPNEGKFPDTLQQTMARIYSEWLSSSGYRIRSGPSFSFTKMDPHKKDHGYSEIWIPVS